MNDIFVPHALANFISSCIRSIRVSTADIRERGAVRRFAILLLTTGGIYAPA